MMPAADHATTILRDAEGVAYGIVLGADYVSQHECGVERMQSTLGITAKGGFSTLVNRRNADHLLHLVRTGTSRGTGRSTTYHQVAILTTDARSAAVPSQVNTRNPGDLPITASFDERDFAIVAHDEESAALLELLLDAQRRKDLAVWMANDPNPFGRGGLCIARASMVPAEHVAAYDDAVRERDEIARLAAATGIEKRIRKGIVGSHPGLPFYALSAARTGRQTTSHPVVFWLNPSNQTDHAYGWFTVEELDEWIAGKGPVIERSKSALARASRATVR